MTCEVINNIPGIENKSYLELGYRDGRNFKLIRCQEKMSVDINGLADFTGTTDEFFLWTSPAQVWDIIFIDACHDYDYVMRDFNHSIQHAREWVILHDMIPPAERYTARTFCSDGYKVLYRLVRYTGLAIYPMAVNMGLTFIKVPSWITPNMEIEVRDCNLPYAEFMKFIKGKKLYSEAEMIGILKK